MALKKEKEKKHAFCMCDEASWSLNFKKSTLSVSLLISISFLAQVFNEIMMMGMSAKYSLSLSCRLHHRRNYLVSSRNKNM